MEQKHFFKKKKNKRIIPKVKSQIHYVERGVELNNFMLECLSNPLQTPAEIRKTAGSGEKTTAEAWPPKK